MSHGAAYQTPEDLLHQPDPLLHAIGEAAPFGIWSCAITAELTYLSPSFLDMLGLSLEECRQGRLVERMRAEDWERLCAAWQRCTSAGVPLDQEYRILGGDGRYRIVLSRGAVLRDPSGRTIGWGGVNLDMTARYQTETDSRFIAETGRQLLSSLDYHETLAQIARAPVPTLADWCILDTINEHEVPHRIVEAQRDPAYQTLLDTLQNAILDLTSSELPAQVLRTGQSVLIRDISPAEAVTAIGGANPTSVQALQPRSLLIVAIQGRGRTLGALTLARSPKSPPYESTDMAMAHRLADLAAHAIEQAQLYREAQAALSSRDELISFVSHDLKNPLGTIRGYAQLLQRRLDRSGSVPHDRLSDALIKIESATSRMATLIDKLLGAAMLRDG